MKGKGAKSLSASKMKVSGGGGSMYGFKGAGPQKPGVSSVEKGSTSGKFAKGGNGKMHGFSGVKAVKKA